MRALSEVALFPRQNDFLHFLHFLHGMGHNEGGGPVLHYSATPMSAQPTSPTPFQNYASVAYYVARHCLGTERSQDTDRDGRRIGRQLRLIESWRVLARL